METTSLQIDLGYLFSKFSSLGNVYVFVFHTDVFIDVALMLYIRNVSIFASWYCLWLWKIAWNHSVIA